MSLATQWSGGLLWYHLATKHRPLGAQFRGANIQTSPLQRRDTLESEDAALHTSSDSDGAGPKLAPSMALLRDTP